MFYINSEIIFCFRTMCGLTSRDTTPTCRRWLWKTQTVWDCSTNWTGVKTCGSSTTAFWKTPVSTCTAASAPPTHMVGICARWSCWSLVSRCSVGVKCCHIFNCFIIHITHYNLLPISLSRMNVLMCITPSFRDWGRHELASVSLSRMLCCFFFSFCDYCSSKWVILTDCLFQKGFSQSCNFFCKL